MQVFYVPGNHNSSKDCTRVKAKWALPKYKYLYSRLGKYFLWGDVVRLDFFQMRRAQPPWNADLCTSAAEVQFRA